MRVTLFARRLRLTLTLPRCVSIVRLLAATKRFNHRVRRENLLNLRVLRAFCGGVFC